MQRVLNLRSTSKYGASCSTLFGCGWWPLPPVFAVPVHLTQNKGSLVKISLKIRIVVKIFVGTGVRQPAILAE